jgi:1-deoxy-D-xylulose-5-phosphate synthase
LLDETQLPQVAQELRDFIIDIVAKKKVILAQALGIELTIALHYVFDTPNDLFGMWAIKPMGINPDRRENFHTTNSAVFLVSKRSERSYDTLAGHSSTSISAALGMAIASN